MGGFAYSNGVLVCSFTLEKNKYFSYTCAEWDIKYHE